MSTDTFKIRLPFNPRYGWHKSKKQPCANYRVYNDAGKRKLRTKYFSRGHELHSSESLAEFDQWRKRMIDGLTPHTGHIELEYTVEELCRSWLDYRRETSPDYGHDKRVAVVLEAYKNYKTNDFRSSIMLAIRDSMRRDAEVRGHRNRDTVNRYVRDAISIFAWGSMRDFVKAEVIASLREIKPLTRRESPGLRGRKTVYACEQTSVEQLIAVANPTLATMLTLQLETGMRPKELRLMQWEDIDQSGPLWVYVPKSHKNRHREESRREKNQRAIYLNRRAQEVLWHYHASQRPDPLNKFLFTVRESSAFNLLDRHRSKYPQEVIELLQRITRQKNRRYGTRALSVHPDVYTYAMAAEELGMKEETVRTWTKKRPWEMTLSKAFQNTPLKGPHEFTKDKYHHAINRLAKQAGLEGFSAYQIRHLKAEQLDQQFGREAAAAVLGHSNISTTAIYAKRNHELAREIQSRADQGGES